MLRSRKNSRNNKKRSPSPLRETHTCEAEFNEPSELGEIKKVASSKDRV